jgi:cytidyltransferase-like protein
MTEEPGTTYVNLADLDFDVSSLNEAAINQQLAEIGSKYINKYDKIGEKDDLALVVGRFQPPHLGHLFQILAALEVAQHVAIGLGSANPEINSPTAGDSKSEQMDRDNPFPAEEREYFLRHLLTKVGKLRGEDLLSRVSFVPLPDVHKGQQWHNDDEWFDNTIAAVGALGKGRLDVTVANDGWVKSVFQKKARRVLLVDFSKHNGKDRYEARLDRERLRQSQDGGSSVLARSGRHRFRR